MVYQGCHGTHWYFLHNNTSIGPIVALMRCVCMEALLYATITRTALILDPAVDLASL